MFQRYAVFLCPTSGLAEAGASWLGWNSESGREAVPEFERATRRPRKYGFHGTLKPPMKLAEGLSEAGLKEAIAGLCQGLKPVAPIRLKLSRIGGFLALVPERDVPDLAAVASEVVRGLDRFRAEPSEAETARRRGAKLTAVEEQNLERWGYPYVMEAFRFHMTLTGPVPRADFEEIKAKAEAHFAEHLTTPMPVTELCLLGEAKDGRFHQIERFRLKG